MTIVLLTLILIHGVLTVRRINVLERRVMTSLQQLKDAVSDVIREGTETILAATAKIEQLVQNQEDPTLQTQINDLTAQIKDAAQKQDDFQKKINPPTEEPTGDAPTQ